MFICFFFFLKGTFGVMDEGHEIAMKVGKPVFAQTIKVFNKSTKQNGGKKINNKKKKIFFSFTKEQYLETIISSECPLAMDHIRQGVTETLNENKTPQNLSSLAPVELIAKSYGLL